MHPQTTVEPAHAVSAPSAPVAGREASSGVEAQLALSLANDLLSQALATRDAAYAHLAENPDDVSDANAAVQAAQQTVNEIREIARGQRRGDLTRVNQLLNSLNIVVRSATDEVNDHDGASAGEAVKRSAHQAEVADRKEAAQRRSSPAASARSRGRVERPPTAETSAPRAGNAGRNEANEGDPLAQAAAARGPQRRTRADDDAPDAHRTVRGGAAGRGVARAQTAVRRRGYDAARAVGILDDQGAETAQRLETGIVNAETVEERQYYERETTDAIARRLGGRTFLGQEIDNALPALERTAVGRELIARDNTFSSSLYGSSVIDRLRENGYIVGDRSWNPFAHEANSQWSDAAVRRIDRNGDGQLTAAEIAYALTHRYGVRPAAPAARPAAATFDSELQSLLGAVNRTNWEYLTSADGKRTFDRNGDGQISLGELKDALRRAGVTSLSQVGNGDNDITIQELNGLRDRIIQRERARIVRND